jgi:hypothetical protein
MTQVASTLLNENNPNSMVPRCTALWEWYKQLSTRIAEAIHTEDLWEVEKIAREIDEHASEMEYQCRI